MLENFIMPVRRPKGVSSERVAFVSLTAQASAAACKSNTGIVVYSLFCKFDVLL